MQEAREEFPVWDQGKDKPFDISTCPEAAALLENYSLIRPAELEKHVNLIAQKGWDISGYPCFRRFLFLHMDILRSPCYQTVLDRIKNGALFIDLGSGAGQDIRCLVNDGAPSINIYGLELRRDLVDLGYELFRDRNTLKSTFLIQDFFEDTPLLNTIKGKLGVVNSGYFMHLWDWAGQIKLARRMVKMLAPTPVDGALVTGLHMGLPQPKTVTFDNGKEMFLHSNDSLRELWGEVEVLTGGRFEVEISVDDDEGSKLYFPDNVLLRWSVLVR